MHLFSNYLLILLLMVTWPALLLLFLVFSAWLDRFAAQPPGWVLRRQAAAQARAEALSASGDAAATGRTRYWNPPRSGKAAPAAIRQAAPAPAPLAERQATPAPAPAPRAERRPPAAGRIERGVARRPEPPRATPGGDGTRRRTSIDENTEPMDGYPVDQLPPERPVPQRHPPAARQSPATGGPSRVPARRDVHRP